MNGTLYQVEDLTQAGMLVLMNSYNNYIQDANEENRYIEGWYPVCINEYLNNEFLYEVGNDIFKYVDSTGTDHLSYELGVVASRIHPLSKGYLLPQLNEMAYDPEGSLYYLSISNGDITKKDFIAGFVAEILSDYSEEENPIDFVPYEHAEEIYKAVTGYSD